MGTRAAASIYIAAVGLLAAFTVILSAGAIDGPSDEALILAAVFALLTSLATAWPVHFGFRANIDLTTLLIVAIVLTFEPGLAVLIAFIGAITGQLLLQSGWRGVVFNGGQVVLQSGMASAILAGFGWDTASPAYSDPRFLPVFALMMLSIFLLNTILVSIVIGLQARMSVWLVWREALTTDLLIEQASQFALGLVTAVVISVQVWIVPILLAPGLMFYISASRKRYIEFQTEEAINALADLVDQRDPYTADHSLRVAVVARELASRIGLAPHEVTSIERAARVHDLGKLVIDLAVLNKDGPLSAAEWRLFKRHPTDGANILTWFPEFRDSAEIVRYHHERWDGGGYPLGISGASIPLGARILAVADALDAMSSARAYRPPLPAAAIVAEFQDLKGRQWDPWVVDALLELVDAGVIDLVGMGDAPLVYDGLGTLVQGR